MTKTITKLISTVLSLAMVAALAACSGKKNDVSPSDTTSAAQIVDTTVKVGALLGPTGVSMAKLATEKTTFAEAFTADGKKYVNAYETDFADEPTQMVAKITSGEVDIACVPTNLAAKLYKKTDGKVKVAAVSTLGVLYLFDTTGTVNSAADLDGKTVYAPSSVKGANPEYILSYVIAQNNVKTKVNYDFTVDELIAKMIKGDVKTAMIPEPKATAAKGQLKKAGQECTVVNLQDEWNKVCQTEIAQGVVIVRSDWLAENEGAFKTFLNDFAASSDAAVNDLDNTVAQVVALGVIPNEALAKQAIPNCNIVCRTGDNMKESVAGFIDVLLAADPQSVGGEAPDEAFYYLG